MKQGGAIAQDGRYIAPPVDEAGKIDYSE